jgi:hypothetical protein
MESCISGVHMFLIRVLEHSVSKLCYFRYKYNPEERTLRKHISSYNLSCSVYSEIRLAIQTVAFFLSVFNETN